MKAAFLTWSMSRRSGGMLDCTRRLGQELSAGAGVVVQLFAPEDEFSKADSHLWKSLPLHLARPTGPKQLAFAPALGGLLGSFAPDLVHTHGLWTYPSVVASRWHAKTQRPTVISPHGMLDSWALRNSRGKKRIAWWLWERSHLKHAACLHAVADAEVSAFRDSGLRNPICIIPNAVDLPVATRPAEPAPWSDSIRDDAKVLLFLSRIHPKKGLPALLQAWVKVRSAPSAESWHLVIVGWDQGGHVAKLRALTSDLGLQSSVAFLGPLFGEAKEAAYRHADAFILPSKGEGLPLAVLEAWAHKLPVVMTPQCNIPQGFTSNAAISAEPQTASLAEALRALFSMADTERKGMGERGYKLVQEKFTWQKAAKDMKAVYDWVPGQGDSPDCVITD